MNEFRTQTRYGRLSAGSAIDPCETDRKKLRVATYPVWLERFLYRLSRSAYRDRLVLKGGLLLMGLGIPQARVTRDLDLLGLFSGSIDEVSEIIRAIGIIREDDGLSYDFSKFTAEQVAGDEDYPGVRIKFGASLKQARIPMQIDVGFGDIIAPSVKEILFPTLLEMEQPRLVAYSIETVVAEKIEAAMSLAMLNSRMKDLFDIWMLSATHPFEGSALQEAVVKTCRRRSTKLSSLAVVFTAEYAASERMHLQWKGFVNRNAGANIPMDFVSIMDGIHKFLLPVVKASEEGRSFSSRWSPNGPWTKQDA